MRKRSRIATLAIVLLLAALHAACAARSRPWRPIPGATVKPWEQTRAICDPILQTDDSSRTKAEYRSCMAKHGWTDQAVSREGQAIQRERDEALRQEAEQLKAEIQKRRTKNELTLFVGVAPDCQPGDPGTEICSWKWNWKSRTQEASAPIQMTCVLRKDGRPREAESCRVDPGY